MADVVKAPYGAMAKEAFDYVKKNMLVGARNRILDQPDIFGHPFMNMGARIACVGVMRKEADKVLVPMQEAILADWKKRMGEKYGWLIENKSVHARPETVDFEFAAMKMDTYGKTVDIHAGYAIAFGYGNCMEQSALTFQYLRDRGVRPLDWIAQEKIFTVPVLGTDVGDHAFVIIGRDRKADVGDVSKWNPEVVWCDPYENEMGGLDEIKERFKGKMLSLMHRLD
jgi:hypothetical protein